MGRFRTAWQAFWGILKSPEAAERWQMGTAAPALQAVEAPPGPGVKRGAGTVPADAVYTLVLLQRQGRLIDFLEEDIDAYSDAQVGAAVRQIHASCRDVLRDTFGIVPVREEKEGDRVTVDRDFDPNSMRLTGRVAGEPPFSGTLQHPGWRVTKADLPARAVRLDPTVICPAEVEI